MLFHNRRTRAPEHLHIQLQHEQLENVTNTKFLGIILQDTLDWDLQIKNIATKISKVIAILSRLKYHLPCYVLKTIYHSLINPHLIYGTMAWCTSSSKSINRLEKLQKKVSDILMCTADVPSMHVSGTSCC